MSIVPSAVWVLGKTRTNDTSYAVSGDWQYNSRSGCDSCGSNDVDTGCVVSYNFPSSSTPNAHDWAFGTLQDCGFSGQQPNRKISCLNPGPEICPVIGGIQSQVQWGSNSEQSGASMWSATARIDGDLRIVNNTNTSYSNVNCYYPLAAFANSSAVQAFSTEFIDNNPFSSDNEEEFRSKVLPLYCASQTTSCPDDPLTGLPMKACSRFVSIDPNDNFCQQLLTTGDPGECDDGRQLEGELAKSAYCGQFNTPDCLCYNRAENAFYQVMSLGNNVIDDKCWWAPCQDSVTAPSTYLVPASLPCCTADNVVVCNTINAVIGGNSTGLSFDADQLTDCDSTSNTGTTPSDDSTFWSQFWWLIVLVIVIVIVIVVAIFFLLR